MDQATELMQQLPSSLRRLWSHAYVLGGSPCSGKSTIAARLAEQFGLSFYKVDDHDQAHMARCRPEQQPVMCSYAGMTWNDIWMRPVPLQVAEEFAFYHERFAFILQDLAQFDPARPVILEGAALLPHLVRACGVRPTRALYMVPTADFQVRHYGQRPWIQDILQQCTDPAQAFANWMARDQEFGQEVLRQAHAAGYRTLVVDGTQTLDDEAAQIAGHFGLR